MRNIFLVMRRIMTVKAFGQYILGMSNDDCNKAFDASLKIVGVLSGCVIVAILLLAFFGAILDSKEQAQKQAEREAFLARTVVFHGDTLEVVKQIGGYTYILEETEETPTSGLVYSFTYASTNVPDSIDVKTYLPALEKAFAKKTKNLVVGVNSYDYRSFSTPKYYHNGERRTTNMYTITTTDIKLKEQASREYEAIRQEEENRQKSEVDRYAQSLK